MTISSDIKNRILQTINVFETGSIEGEYDNITIYNDGKNNTRQITYGRSQTTEQGHLNELIKKYIENNGLYASVLAAYLPKIGVTPLDKDTAFIEFLKNAAQEDPIMRETQDAFFDTIYYKPALKFANDNGFILPLSMLVIYDSYIHSGGILQFLRDRFEEVPPTRGGEEKAWIKAYVRTRHNWLENKSPLLAKTVYRMETFELQMAVGNWMLTQPISANGSMTRGLDDDAPNIVQLDEKDRALLRGNGKYVETL
jgi:chitosanase